MSLFPEILPADPAAPEHYRPTPRPVKYGLFGRLFMFIEAARERRIIARMSDRTLRDIGLTRDDARAFSERRFWDVPTGWRTDIERTFSRPGML